MTNHLVCETGLSMGVEEEFLLVDPMTGNPLPVAGRIPDATMRDRFADRLAFKARVTDEVVRAEIAELLEALRPASVLPRAPRNSEREEVGGDVAPVEQV